LGLDVAPSVFGEFSAVGAKNGTLILEKKWYLTKKTRWLMLIGNGLFAYRRVFYTLREKRKPHPTGFQQLGSYYIRCVSTLKRLLISGFDGYAAYVLRALPPPGTQAVNKLNIKLDCVRCIQVQYYL
jgi:hypothetical protein